MEIFLTPLWQALHFHFTHHQSSLKKFHYKNNLTRTLTRGKLNSFGEKNKEKITYLINVAGNRIHSPGFLGDALFFLQSKSVFRVKKFQAISFGQKCFRADGFQRMGRNGLNLMCLLNEPFSAVIPFSVEFFLNIAALINIFPFQKFSLSLTNISSTLTYSFSGF